jgi:hypothetical protein
MCRFTAAGSTRRSATLTPDAVRPVMIAALDHPAGGRGVAARHDP